jgi:hypothetical protein
MVYLLYFFGMGQSYLQPQPYTMTANNDTNDFCQLTSLHKFDYGHQYFAGLH